MKLALKIRALALAKYQIAFFSWATIVGLRCRGFLRSSRRLCLLDSAL